MAYEKLIKICQVLSQTALSIDMSLKTNYIQIMKNKQDLLEYGRIVLLKYNCTLKTSMLIEEGNSIL